MVLNFLSLAYILQLFLVVSIILSMCYTLFLPDISNSESSSKNYLNYSSLLPVRFEKAELFNNPEKLNFSYYKSSNYGIAIKYPNNWSIIESVNNISNNYRFLTLFTLEEYANDFKEYLGFHVYPPYFYRSLEEGLRVTSELQNLKIRQPYKETTIGNITFGDMIYTYSDSKYGEVIILKIGFLYNDKFYTIYYSAQNSKFDDYLPTVKEIIRSLNLYDTKYYENFDMGIKMKYNSNWEFHEQAKISGLGLQNKTIFNLEFNKRLLNNKLEISTFFIDPSIDFKKFIKEKMEEYSRQSLYPNLIPISKMDIFPEINLLSNFSLYNFTNNIFDDVSISVFSYDGFPNKKFNGLQIFGKSIHTNKIYSILFTSEKEKFNRYLPEILESIHSMKIFKLLTYEHFDRGMKFQYPSYWTYKNDIDIETSSLSYADYSIFYPTKKPIPSEIYPHIKVFSFYTRNNTISDMVEKQINYYKTKNKLYNSLNITKPDLPNSQILNFSYYKYDSYSPIIIKCSELITNSLIEKKEYHVQYCAEKETYYEHLPVMNKIIKTLQTFGISRYEKNLNHKGGLLLEYPSTWNRVENSSSDENISFNEIDVPSIHINIFSDNRTVIDMEKSYIKTYQTNDFDIIKKELTNLNSTREQLIPANKVTFKYLFHDNFDKLIYIYGIHLYAKFNGYIYSIWYYSTDSKQLSSAEIMLNSIKIMDSYRKYDVNFTDYNDVSMSFDIQIPTNWIPTTISDDAIALSIPLSENSSEIDYDSSLYISHTNTLNKSISQIIADNLAVLVDPSFLYPGENIRIIDIGKSDENSSAYISEYILDSSSYQDHYLQTYLKAQNNSLFFIEYVSNTDKYYNTTDKYYNYLPIINHIINSIHVKNKLKSSEQIGLNVGEGPSGIVYNPNTNMIYLANEKTDSVSVFDGSNFKKIKTTKVGKKPSAIAVDPSINIIYVANLESDSISIIDGSQNTEIRSIKVGPYPSELAVNTITHKVYVVDEDNTKLYVIDGPNDVKPDIIPTGGNDLDTGMGVAVNEITNQVFVANPYTQYVNVMEGKTNNILKNISMTYSSLDLRPFAIRVNPYTNHAYILSYELNDLYLSSLNLNDYKISATKHLGEDHFPSSFFLNKLTNMIYVPMFLNNTLAIIDVTNMSLPMKSIPTDSGPYYSAINEKLDIIYLTNYQSNTMTIVNAANKQNLFGILYTIQTGIINHNIFGFNLPINSTKDAVVYCNGKRFINNTYTLYDNGTLVECLATSEMNGRTTPIVSSLWYGQENTNNNLNKFIVTGHGNVSGKFADFGNLLRLISPIISLFVLVSVIILSLLPPLIIKIRHKNKFLFVDKRQKELLSKIEIITIDGSIIVGILFFLTVTEGFEQHEQNEITLITAGVILPFAISVIGAITNHENIATRLTLAGFINLIISIILIVGMKIFI